VTHQGHLLCEPQAVALAGLATEHTARAYREGPGPQCPAGPGPSRCRSAVASPIGRRTGPGLVGHPLPQGELRICEARSTCAPAPEIHTGVTPDALGRLPGVGPAPVASGGGIRVADGPGGAVSSDELRAEGASGTWTLVWIPLTKGPAGRCDCSSPTRWLSRSPLSPAVPGLAFLLPKCHLSLTSHASHPLGNTSASRSQALQPAREALARCLLREKPRGPGRPFSAAR
jgi:hypothetical protein